MTKVKVEDEVLTELRKAVLQKHQKLYGFLKKEINIAIKERAEKLMKESRGS